MPNDRQEDRHLRWRPLQLHYTGTAPKTSSRKTLISASQPGALQPSDFSRLWKNNGIATTKEAGPTFSATAFTANHRHAATRMSRRWRGNSLRMRGARSQLGENQEPVLTPGFAAQASTEGNARGDGSHRSIRAFMLQTQSGCIPSSSLLSPPADVYCPVGRYRLWLSHRRQFGLRIEDTRAGLVPLTPAPQVQNHWQKLSGISIDALVGCEGLSSPEALARFRENILITHRGLSGLRFCKFQLLATRQAHLNQPPAHKDLTEILSSRVSASGSAQDSEIKLVTLLRVTYRAASPRRGANFSIIKTHKAISNQGFRKSPTTFTSSSSPRLVRRISKGRSHSRGVSTDELSSQTWRRNRLRSLLRRRSCGCHRTLGG